MYTENKGGKIDLALFEINNNNKGRWCANAYYPPETHPQYYRTCNLKLETTTDK